MRNLIFLSMFILVTFTLNGQSWTYSEGGNVFDGKYKTSSTTGKGYEFPYTKPVFVINVFEGKADEPNIYLTNVPSSVCANNKVLIKFDGDDYTFRPSVTSSSDKETWFLNFYSLDFSTNSILSKDTIFETHDVMEYKIESGAKLVMRKEFNPNSPILLTLNKEEIIELFIHMKNGFWGGRFINSKGDTTIGFINDLYIGDLKVNGKYTKKTIRVPIIKEYVDPNLKGVGLNQELANFIDKLKSYKIMHVRLLSDCIKSDFEFSLIGSSAAVNFVFRE